MELRNIAAIYSIIIGIAMIGMWLSLITTNQVPEINTEPIRITNHLIGEFLTVYDISSTNCFIHRFKFLQMEGI